MSSKVFNTDIEVKSGADGVGKIGYDNGAYLGGLPVANVTTNTNVTWAHRGKLIRVANSSTATVTLPDMATNADLAGMVVYVQRATSSTANVVVADASDESSVTLEAAGSWLIATAGAAGWHILSASQGVSLQAVDGQAVGVDVTGSGTPGDPFEVTAELIVDPDADNLLSVSASGAFVGIVTGNGISGKGTVADPLTVTSIALTEVSVVADIAARDALSADEGDVAKVLDDGAGKPQTYIYDGTQWIVIEDRSDVNTVNGQTGTVVLNLDDINDVNTAAAAAGEFLQFDGSGWVPYALPLTAYLATVALVGGTPYTITHNLDTSYPFEAMYTTTGAKAELEFSVVDADTVEVAGNANGDYKIHLLKYLN